MSAKTLRWDYPEGGERVEDSEMSNEHETSEQRDSYPVIQRDSVGLYIMFKDKTMKKQNIDII